jgi:hypothetical protein
MGATEELERGIAALLAQWERSADLASDGAARIVQFILSSDHIHEALIQALGRPQENGDIRSCPHEID